MVGSIVAGAEAVHAEEAMVAQATTAQATTAQATTARGADDALAAALRARLEGAIADPPVRAAGAPLAASRLVTHFYAQRGHAPAWRDAARRELLLAALEAAPSHGLDPDDYRIEDLRRVHRALEAAATPAAVTDAELLFTDAVVRYAYHLRFGKAEPRRLDPDFNFDRSLGSQDPLAVLAALVDAPDPAVAIERMAPPLDAYRNLRRALERLRRIERAGGWPTVAPGPKLELGRREPRVARLRERLRIEGDLPALAPDVLVSGASAPDPERFDAALDAAVRRFQQRHGLEVDGIVGPRTLAALAATVRDRIDQLRVNLDRIRWIAGELEGDFLLVDIAGFDAELWLDGRRVWYSRTVVGRAYRSTPVFRATLQYLVFNPDWTVPPTILRRDVLPKVIADPQYLQRNRMQVQTFDGRPIDPAGIDWARYRNGGFPYQIVQAPGPQNPLGRVKFMFPNRHAVYLHDTPARELFERTQRAFSSGCIRVARPLELAELLLDDRERWSSEAIQAAVDGGRMQSVPVRLRVPVLILYFTATADADGMPRFRPDLYERDAPVLEALARPFRFGQVDARLSLPP